MSMLLKSVTINWMDCGGRGETAPEASRLEDWTEATPEAIGFEAALGGDREAGGPR